MKKNKLNLSLFALVGLLFLSNCKKPKEKEEIETKSEIIENEDSLPPIEESSDLREESNEE